MGLFNHCNHKWEEKGRTYQAPMWGAKVKGFVNEQFMREMAQGITTIELRCEHCGDITTKQFLGKVGID